MQALLQSVLHADAAEPILGFQYLSTYCIAYYIPNTKYLRILNSQMIFYRDVEIEPYLQAGLLKLRCN